MHSFVRTYSTIGVRVEVTVNYSRSVRSFVELFAEPTQLFVSQCSLSRIQQDEVCVRQFDYTRLNAKLLFL